MAKRGRRTIRTAEVAKTLRDVIRLGGSDADACLMAGIDDNTFYRWLNDDGEFREGITRARASGKVERIGRIRKHGETDWRADAWYLERRWPDEYAQHMIIKVAPEDAKRLKEKGLTAAQLWADMMQELANADASTD